MFYTCAFLALILAIFVVFICCRYVEESVYIEETPYVIRTDRIFGTKCAYPARKYHPSEISIINEKTREHLGMDFCFSEQ